MQLSIHYYILSLSRHTCRLYEGFRDRLIDIKDTYFPFEFSNIAENSTSKDTALREFLQQTDQRFAHYFKQDPLRLVVTGQRADLDIFESVTAYREIIMGKIEGDYLKTSTHDLGRIVWPVVKDAIAGVNINAMEDLERAAKEKKVIHGITKIGQATETEACSTLYVEDDYHVRGSIRKTDQTVVLSKNINLWDVIDDVVDIIIEKVLKMGGTVVFLNNGSLLKLDRIALVLSG